MFWGYLDSVEALEPTPNVAALVGHAATRFYVMENVEEAPTPQDVKRYRTAGQSIKEGRSDFQLIG